MNHGTFSASHSAIISCWSYSDWQRMEHVSEGRGGVAWVPVYHSANSLKILLIIRPHCIYVSVSNGLEGLSWEICHGDYLCWYSEVYEGFFFFLSITVFLATLVVLGYFICFILHWIVMINTRYLAFLPIETSDITITACFWVFVD